ncbi:hypothetical protein BD324DRAFT_51549 [Kockovaella imperatae]|uniref:Uncharacterized protein n=1 Tax=Kockovaella imperatae TaxID=4999 RepID=A0A1Y1UT93_9TREE|nr:hypothetical protein BD324DRAFT_51549 [Kockovaella imperatae]ORX41231.1 hypothetical protein BD324DRAFT_51549 [Kockovaella imperatae]
MDHVLRELSDIFVTVNVSMIGLGKHVSTYLEHNRQVTVSAMKDKTKKEALGGIKIDSFTPFFPAALGTNENDALFKLSEQRSKDDVKLDIAVIQCSFWDDVHRNLSGIFADLERHFEADPTAWGYRPITADVDYYEPIPDHPSRFQLYFLGASKPPFESKWKEVVGVRQNLKYSLFYGALNAADIVLPSFGTARYDISRASSTMGVAASASVSPQLAGSALQVNCSKADHLPFGPRQAPLLVPQSYIDAYGYLCPAFGVLRKDGLSEIDYVAEVRRGAIPWESRRSREEALSRCQEDWTAKNMYVLSRLFGLL